MELRTAALQRRRDLQHRTLRRRSADRESRCDLEDPQHRSDCMRQLRAMTAVSHEPIVRRTTAGEALRLSDELADVRRHSNLLFARTSRPHHPLQTLGPRHLLDDAAPAASDADLHRRLLRTLSRQLPRYEIYFLSAYIAWNFFAQTTAHAIPA